MAKHGKKYLAALAKVDQEKVYDPKEAMALVKETSYAKFSATIEVHMRMGLDPRQADQQVRDVVVLPNGLGKTVRVLVFAQGEGAAAARSAGADLVADDDETLKKIEGGMLDFDVAIATPGTASLRRRNEPGTLIRNWCYFNRNGSGERRAIGRCWKARFPVRKRVERVDPEGFERARKGSGDPRRGWKCGAGIGQRATSNEAAQPGGPGRAEELGAERVRGRFCKALKR